MKYSNVVLGNSSSGLLEAPSLNIPTINLGNRQKGRIQSKSITNCPLKEKEITLNLKKIFKRKKNKIYKNPYEQLNTSKKIVNILEKKIDFEKLIRKKFYQL